MLMPYFKTVLLSTCLLSLTGFYGCQSAQQKVYQQASQHVAESESIPYHDFESSPSRYEVPDQFSPVPELDDGDNFIPPAAPPSLIPPAPEKASIKDFFSIKKVSQQQEDAGNIGESEEPAQKFLGLVPRYSSTSPNTKLMNGRVKSLCAKMKSHFKPSRWIRSVSEEQEEQVFENISEDISCIDSVPLLEQLPSEPENRHPQPVFPEPDVKKTILPRLPPAGETTYWDNSWKVSATLEQLPVSNSVKNYSTQEDYLEVWPFSRNKMQQETQSKQFQNRVPASIPRRLSDPTILSEENSKSIQKINLQTPQEVQKPEKMETLEDSPILIQPRKVY